MDSIDQKIPLLIVSYLFPPRGGVGVQRIVKFVKYLPQFGFQPVVLTVKKPSGAVAEDPEISKEISPDVKVIRTSSYEAYHLYRLLGGRKRQDDPSFRRELVAGGGKRGILASLYLEYQRRYLIPDPKVGWMIPALNAGERIFKEHAPKAIFSTSPEATAHVIALKLHEKYHVHFIADFRDPWTSGYYSLNRPPKARERELALEKRVLTEASAVIVVMKSYIDGFRKSHPEIPLEKFHVIPNGFDESDYENIKPKKFGYFTCAHTGSIYHQRSPEPLFKAIQTFLKNRPEAINDFRLFLMGQVDTQYFKLAIEMGIADVIINEGFASHSESLSVQQGSNALVLLSEGMMTAKVYEYLRAAKPIIGFAPMGELSQQIDEWGVGKVFPPSEHESATKYLMELYDAWKTSGGKTSFINKAVDLAPYERRHQAEILARIMHEIID